MVRRFGPLILFVVACAAACGSAGSGPANEPPIAEIDVEPIAPVATPVLINAGRSSDPDGVIVSYTFQFADGSPELVSPVAEITHPFPRGGRFQVAVIVTDD